MTGSIPHQQIAVGKRKSYGPFWFANEKAEAVKCIWGHRRTASRLPDAMPRAAPNCYGRSTLAATDGSEEPVLNGCSLMRPPLGNE
jgi:hypothetical protein